jgi:hypothetical protein
MKDEGNREGEDGRSTACTLSIRKKEERRIHPGFGGSGRDLKDSRSS